MNINLISYYYLIVAIFYIFHLNAFTPYDISSRKCNRNILLEMKFSYSKGMGGAQDLGLVGAEGELYYHPTKTVALKGTPSSAVGKKIVVPIYPYNNILCPLASDCLNIFEMRHRQLFNEIGDGLFGLSHYSNANQRLSLVGTLARVKEKKLLPDGRIYAVIEGVKRYYLSEFRGEKPYIKAKIQSFQDYTESPEMLDELETELFLKVRLNIKLMQMLYPSKNYVISQNILKYKPTPKAEGVRSISLNSLEQDLERMSHFSFSVMEMLQINPPTKLMLLQELIIEKRFIKIMKILEKGGTYLKSEILKRNLMTESELRNVEYKIMSSKFESDPSLDTDDSQNWSPENFVDGKWIQKAILM